MTASGGKAEPALLSLFRTLYTTCGQSYIETDNSTAAGGEELADEVEEELTALESIYSEEYQRVSPRVWAVTLINKVPADAVTNCPALNGCCCPSPVLSSTVCWSLWCLRARVIRQSFPSWCFGECNASLCVESSSSWLAVVVACLVGCSNADMSAQQRLHVTQALAQHAVSTVCFRAAANVLALSPVSADHAGLSDQLRARRLVLAVCIVLHAMPAPPNAFALRCAGCSRIGRAYCMPM